MKLYLCIFIMLQFVLFTGFLKGKEEFKQIDQWKHDEVFGRDFFSFIDKDNHVVGGFRQIGCRIVTPENIVKFAPRGQGPSDLSDFMAAFPYKNDDIAIVELPMKIKIFTKKNGTYVWKETKWLKQGKYVQIINNGLYFDGKFFLTGEENLSKEESILLKVFDEDGKPLKILLKRSYTQSNRFYMQNFYVKGYNSDTVFFMLANALKATVISSKTLEEVKDVELERPSFYKEMPRDFFLFKKYKNPNNLEVDLEKWITGYSSISEVAVDGKFLVVQVRTCSEKLKKFALLFYNIENNFKLERTVFTNDFLLDIKDGKYYCFANGNPGRDEDTDECIINIYSWVK